MVSPDCFFISVRRLLLSSVICYEAFCIHVLSNFFFSPLFLPKLGLYVILLESVHLFCDFSNCIRIFSHILHSILFCGTNYTDISYFVLQVRERYFFPCPRHETQTGSSVIVPLIQLLCGQIAPGRRNLVPVI